jgi:hypothetical protein
VPILSEGSDVDIRDIKFKGNSKFSGEFFIEDVKQGDDLIPTRRLIFQKINPIIQTEIILKKGNYMFLSIDVLHSKLANLDFFVKMMLKKVKTKLKITSQTMKYF